LKARRSIVIKEGLIKKRKRLYGMFFNDENRIPITGETKKKTTVPMMMIHSMVRLSFGS
jgi:hypothetical protein